MSTNGDYWSFQEDQRDNRDGNDLNKVEYGWGANQKWRHYNACVSLSVLYPRWIDDIMVFKCPSTDEWTR